MTPRLAATTLALPLALAFGPAGAQDATLGQDTFNQYCATCHGADGKGGGPLSELMTLAAPDLTQLSARNDGVFPMLKVIHVIDGRTGVRAHGGDMPVYGMIFSHDVEVTSGAYAGVLASRGRILSVAYYLESIQE